MRSLYDDGAGKSQDIGREYVLSLDERPGEAPLLTVYGGKITTYRRLAEEAMARLAHFFPRTRPWTAHSALPGGDFVYDGLETLVARRNGLGRSSVPSMRAASHPPMARASTTCSRR